MPIRDLPVRPSLDELMRQAKQLLRRARENDAHAVALLEEHLPRNIDPTTARLYDARLALARSYGIASWERLVMACRMADAIWRDDADAVRDLVLCHPRLLHEDVLGRKSNWGPPMSYAANLGCVDIIAVLHGLGAEDTQHAFERAVLQGEIATARQLRAMGARPTSGSVMGPCETLNVEGLAFLLESGAPFADAGGDPLAPIALLLETYSRNPEGKHRCLELAAGHGMVLPDTPPMALHRGRIDLLEVHLRRDPDLFSRTFSHAEIYPPELGCAEDESLALHGTPLAGATLLHMAVDYDESAVAEWMLGCGADVDAPARIDGDGFGGHTALFGCVVSQAYRCGRDEDAAFAELLLAAGANPTARASLRKRLRYVPDESVHEYHDVTPVTWGEAFQDQDWVNPAALRAIAARSGAPR